MSVESWLEGLNIDWYVFGYLNFLLLAGALATRITDRQLTHRERVYYERIALLHWIEVGCYDKAGRQVAGKEAVICGCTRCEGVRASFGLMPVAQWKTVQVPSKYR